MHAAAPIQFISFLCKFEIMSASFRSFRRAHCERSLSDYFKEDFYFLYIYNKMLNAKKWTNFFVVGFFFFFWLNFWISRVIITSLLYHIHNVSRIQWTGSRWDYDQINHRMIERKSIFFFLPKSCFENDWNGVWKQWLHTCQKHYR